MNHYPTKALVFDVETWIDWSFIRGSGFLAELERSYEPPTNYKCPLKIAAHHSEWWMKQRDKWSLSPLTAQVCSIAWGDLWSEDITVVTSPDEAEVLGAFVDALAADEVVLTGYAIRHFDIGFVTARASALKMTLPPWWPHERDYWHVADIMDAVGKGKLDHWLERLGLPRKTAQGNMVEVMPVHEIRDYNRHDVHVERLFARQFAPNIPALRDTVPHTLTKLEELQV